MQPHHARRIDTQTRNGTDLIATEWRRPKSQELCRPKLWRRPRPDPTGPFRLRHACAPVPGVAHRPMGHAVLARPGAAAGVGRRAHPAPGAGAAPVRRGNETIPRMKRIAAPIGRQAVGLGSHHTSSSRSPCLLPLLPLPLLPLPDRSFRFRSTSCSTPKPLAHNNFNTSRRLHDGRLSWCAAEIPARTRTYGWPTFTTFSDSARPSCRTRIDST